MKFKLIEGLHPGPRTQARKDVEYHEEQIYSVFSAMMSRATKEEVMAWCDEVYERAFDDYNDWLSTQ